MSGPHTREHGRGASPGDYLRSLPLYLLPHHLLSRIVLRATRWRWPPWKNLLIRVFRRLFDVDLEEARIRDPADFRNFNHFFTRALKSGARRPDEAPDCIRSPVDATISQLGRLRDGQILQAKGRDYTVRELLGGDDRWHDMFGDGHFATLYLSPRDYHRIHMPCTGRLLETVYVPGRLFSVAPHTTRTIPRLFARNERLVCLFDTEHGPMAMVLVGAIFVACIETVWGGVATPPHGRRIRREDFGQAGRNPVTLAAGEEMGRFNMGSTVILLFPADRIEWEPALHHDRPVRMGERIGSARG